MMMLGLRGNTLRKSPDGVVRLALHVVCGDTVTM